MIKVPEHKEPQHNLVSEKFLSPSKLYLPLAQHTGAPSLPCVKKGDIVDQGDVIANAQGLIPLNCMPQKRERLLILSIGTTQL